MKTCRTCSWALDYLYLLCALIAKQIQPNQGQFHREGNNIIKPIKLHSVLLTHDSHKRAVLPQSQVQSALSADVCANSIFKLASALCFKQDSIR